MACFFKSVKMRQNRNEIKAIKNSEGRWISSQDDIAKEFMQHFESLF